MQLQLRSIYSKIVLALYWYGANRPSLKQSSYTDVSIIPWAFQLLSAYAWLNYASLNNTLHQSDVFIYLQNIPALIAAISVTLQWHPYLRKKTLKVHEMSLLAGFLLITLLTLGLSVPISINPSISYYALGALAGLFTLIQIILRIKDLFTMVTTNFAQDKLNEDASVYPLRPAARDFVLAAVGILFGGVWAAYGFWGTQQDPFIYVTNLVVSNEKQIASIVLIQ